MDQWREEWRESALGGGLVAAFMLTVGAPTFAVVLFKGLTWAAVVGGLTLALLVFVDRNGSGLRGQVLRPGRAAIFGSVLAGFALRLVIN